MREYLMTCECGEQFIAGNKTAKYCPVCRVERRRKTSREWNKSVRSVKVIPAPVKEKKVFVSLTETAARAKAAGLTYGEYVAKETHRNEKT